MPCSSCGHENPARARFCLECGAPLALRCPRCQVDVPASAKFCPECGTPVGEGESAPRPPGLPSPVPDVARPGERRQLTVLFCDLVGSTPLAQQLDPEDWRDVLAQYHAAAASAVARWGGHVAKNLGDGFLIYFGWPGAREAERATLVERWEQAREGAGQNVVVLGEAGVGKSRLVYQLRERLAAFPHTWLECGATPYTAGTPFHPVIALVAQGLAFAPEDTAAEKLAKVERGLGGLGTAETVALLADLVGLPPPTRLQLSPELQRRKTIELLAQLNLAMSEVQPLVLFVEDLHWCDVSTLELLGHLIAQSPTARVLLLATARPDFTPPWPSRSNLTTVQLARLTKRQARDMVTALGGPELPADTLDALVARADGVPLFVEELTKAVLEAEGGAATPVRTIPATP